MLRAALRRALDQDLAHRTDLRLQPLAQRRLTGRAQALRALPDLAARDLRHPRRRRARAL